MAQYKVGTISVTNGSAVITGSGTDWNNVLYNIKANDSVFIAGDTVDYRVLTVDSATQITLTGAVQRSTAAGLTYAVSKDFTPNINLPLVGTGDIRTDQLFSRAMNNLDTAIGGGTFSPTFDNLTVTGSASIASADINGGSIDSTPIGGTTPAVGHFTGGSFSGTLTTQTINSEAGNISSGLTSGTNANAQLTGDSTQGRLNFRQGATVQSRIISVVPSGDLFYDSKGAQNWRDYISGSTLMRLTNAGQLGIGTTNPAYALDVVGDIRAQSGRLLVNGSTLDGDQTAPHISFALDPDSGIFRPGTNAIAIATTGVERLRISNAGRLGIGTTNPQTDLHVSNTGVAFIRANGGSATYTGVDLSQLATGEGALAVRDNKPLTFLTNNIERMRLNTVGNLGIGTTDPVRAMHVYSTNANVIRCESNQTLSRILFVNSSISETVSIGANGDELALYAGNAKRVAVSSTGNLTMATATSQLLLGQNTSEIALAFNADADTGLGRRGSNKWGWYAGGTVVAEVESFRLNLMQDLLVSSGDVIIQNGFLGVNETNPNYRLDVNGAFGFTPGASVTPIDNGDVVFEATNNTTFTVKLKGADGVIRSGTITLS